MRPKYIVPYGVPILMLGLYGYTLRKILMSDPDGLKTVSGIIVLTLFSLLSIGCLSWIVMAFKQNRQSKRILFGSYPELKGLNKHQIPFDYQNDIWELYIYQNHLISRRSDFKVMDIRDIEQMTFTYYIKTHRNVREKIYQLILLSSDPMTSNSPTLSLELQSGDNMDIRKMMADLFDYIAKHYPEIDLKDHRFEGQRKKDRLKKAWAEGHWVYTSMVFLSILPLYSAIQRGGWGSNDKISLFVFGSLSVIGIIMSIRTILHQQKHRQIMINQYPELASANLAQVCEFTILDLRIYLYQHHFFQQKGGFKFVDLNQISDVTFQVTDISQKKQPIFSYDLRFMDVNGKIITFHLQKSSSAFIYDDKVKELFNHLDKRFPEIALQQDS